MSQTPVNVAVVGGGLWGRSLAKSAARAGSKVTLISRREAARSHEGHAPQPSTELHGVTITKELAHAKHARLILLATPSSVVRQVTQQLGEHLDGSHFIVHGVRGLVADHGADDAGDGDELLTVSDVVRSELAARRLGALGGPALAEDLELGAPSVLVAASRFPEVNELLARALGSAALRIYPTADLRGLEWASALVGCLAIGIGFAKQLSLSPGLIAAVLCRSMNEAGRIAKAAGGDEATLLGLGGYGDLLASVEMKTRPEVLLGRALAQGASMTDALERAGARVEAVELLPKLVRFAERHQVRAPIFAALERGLHKTASPRSLLDELMTLPMA